MAFPVRPDKQEYVKEKYYEAKDRGDTKQIERFGSLLGFLNISSPTPFAQQSSSSSNTEPLSSRTQAIGRNFASSSLSCEETEDSVDDTEESAESLYVQNLKEVNYGDSEDILNQRLVCMKGLGDVYAAKGTKESIIQAAGMYNYALHCARKVKDKRIEAVFLQNLAELEIKLLKNFVKGSDSSNLYSCLSPLSKSI